ncbi:MAG: hypothetical protein HWD62_07790 [Cyclobacteriaceae bacterium]|nr:MAG: hypothetical protein HWD62_07790 [Cyclobacteriaceae bacterium]
MQKLEISATDLTPDVLLDATTRTFKFEGRSVSDNPEEFLSRSKPGLMSMSKTQSGNRVGNTI